MGEAAQSFTDYKLTVSSLLGHAPPIECHASTHLTLPISPKIRQPHWGKNPFVDGSATPFDSGGYELYLTPSGAEGYPNELRLPRGTHRTERIDGSIARLIHHANRSVDDPTRHDQHAHPAHVQAGPHPGGGLPGGADRATHALRGQHPERRAAVRVCDLFAMWVQL